MRFKNFRILILLILSILLLTEIILFYTHNNTLNRFFRTANYLVICYWLYKENRKTKILHIGYLFTSFALLILSLYVVFFVNKQLLDLFELLLITFSYVCIILFFIKEKAKIRFNDTTFIKILVPYLLFPLAFYANAYSFLPQEAIYVSIFFVVILVIMSLLSAFLPYPERSKLYISIGVFLLLLSIGINAYRAYIQSFFGDYVFFQLFDLGFYVFLILGILRSQDEE
jgi:hypothetical protein